MDISIQRDVLREVAPGFAVRQFLSNFLFSRSNWPQFTKIVGEKASLQDFVKAAMVTQVYNYLGIRTIPPISREATSEEATEREIREIFGEISEILGDDFQREIEVLEKRLNAELAVIRSKISGKEENAESFVSRYLAEISTNFPRTHLVDFVGDLLRITYKVRSDFIKKTYGLKPISLELEEEVRKPHEEECVEISTHLKVKEELKKLELESDLGEGKLSDADIKYLSRKITSQIFSHMPKDEFDLKLYGEAYEVKLQIVKILKEYTSKKASLSDLFDNVLTIVLTYLKSKVKEKALLRKAILLIAGYGEEGELEINLDSLQVVLAEDKIYRKILDKIVELGIEKSDLGFLIERYKRLEKIRKVIEEKVIPRLRGRGYNIHAVNLEIFTLSPEKLSGLDELVVKEVKGYISPPPPEEFKLLLDNEATLRRLLEAIGFSDVGMLKIVIDAETTLENLGKQIMSRTLFDCMGHASRVVELYNRVKKDGERFKMLFKLINDENDENLKCVKEELLIELFMQRQKEISEVFPHLTPSALCGFIWARLTSKPLNEAIKELKETVSPLFLGIADAKLKFDEMSPVSYVTAYDLSQRYLEFNKKQMEVIQEAKEKEIEAKEKIKREIYERIDPMGMLEKKLTIALKAPSGIEKVGLEWTKNDTRKLEAMSKIFVRSEIGKKICPHCAREVKNNHCSEHGYVDPIVEGALEALAKFYFYALKIIKELTERKTKETGVKITFKDCLKIVKSIFSELKIRGKLSPKSTERSVMEGDIDRYLVPAIAEEIAQEYMKAIGQIRKVK